MISKNKITGNEGLTLIELMVAMALFVTMMVVATGLFGQAVNNQRTTTLQKNLHESMSYSLNFLKAEVAGAKESLLITAPSTYCGGASASDEFFYTPSRTFLGNTVKDLYFINKSEQCVHYFLHVDNSGVTRLVVTRNGLPASPYFIYLNASDSTMVDFDVDTKLLNSDPEYRSAKLTLFLAAKPVNGASTEILNLQTTVTLTPFVCGQVIYDRDSFSYKTVQIGDQCWMAENLKTKTKPDGTCINSGASFVAPQCTKTVSSIIYGGEDGSGRDCISGSSRGTEVDCLAGYALYNWSAALNLPAACQSANCNGSINNPHQGICPKGWHVPFSAEYTQLVTYLESQYGVGTAGAPLKTIGNCGGAGNCGVSGFNHLLAGSRQNNESSFAEYGVKGDFWLEQFNNPQADLLRISSGADNTVRIAQDHKTKQHSLSMRCLKD